MHNDDCRRRRHTRTLLRRLALTFAIPCAVGAVVASLTGCAHDEGTFNPMAAQRIARAHAAETPDPTMRPIPKTFESQYLPASTRPSTRPSWAAASQPATGPRPIHRFTLQELVKRAVAHNADAHVTAYQPAIDQARVVEANAAFDLKYFANFQYVKQDDLFPSATNPLVDPFSQLVRFNDLQFQTGFKQDTPTGGSVQLQYQADQFDRGGPGFPTSAADKQQDPFWVGLLQLQIKQPLLQNFGAAANQARIDIARNTQKSSALDFRIQLEKSLAELEKDYWQLVEAEQDVRIRESLLTTTRDTAQLLSNRRGTTGTSNTEISQADEAVRAREFDLHQSQAQVEKLSNTIKALLNDPDLPVSGAELVLPADLPTDTPIVFNVEEQINTALAYRPELAQQQTKIDSAEITVRAAKNNELPQFDLVAQFGIDGFAKDFGDATTNQFGWNHFEYTVGFQFQVPVGNREARAITTRTQLQRLQAIYTYRGLVDKVASDVKNAIVDVQMYWDQIVAARRWRLAADEELRRLEQDRVARPEGMSPSLIQTELDAQLRLSEARRQEVAAMAGYSASLAALEQAKGTLLRYDNVVMEEEPEATIPLTWDKEGWKWWKK